MQVAEKTHAKLSPSGAARWTRCPGSVVLEAQVPNESSVYARWGTAAHEIAALVLEPLNGKPFAAGAFDLLQNAEAYVGRIFIVEGHEVECDMEMATCVNDFIAVVEQFIDEGDIVLVEQSVPLTQITGEAGATGTSDVVILKLKAHELVAIDLKGGQGVPVDAEGNEQCAMYAGGALHEHDLMFGPFYTVRAVISQPRRDYVGEEEMSVVELTDRLLLISEAARTALEFEAEATILGTDLNAAGALDPGEKQCKFCNAKSFCPALEGEVRGALQRTAPAERTDFPDLSLPKAAAAVADKENIALLDADRLAEAKRAAPLVELWVSAINSEVDKRLLSGKPVPGFGLFEGRAGNRAWIDAAKAEAEMKKLRIKADDMYEKSVISVTKAETKFKKDKAKWPKLAALIAPRTEGKPVVDRIDCGKTPFTFGAKAESFPIVGEVDPFA